ncbi:flagellar biosynthesis anti-sigma factor FlgM [Alloalcanivorax mobilis]|uniref:flagellar biosynthesis anti-sigma factor FlgM n=1 Tax=Alloalcanivorax mobilis TaxID=2019569 RepID=UPI000C78EEFC|nr:flagellar biosynthesis anti-sigma factor FlgM [Alloalcanivorax mobilis]
MKIDNISHLGQNNAVSPGKSSEKAATDAVKSGGAGDSASVTHLSQSGNDGSQDIDQARVDELRQAIAEGRLEIRADRIADGLIASVQDLLGGEQP